MLHNKFINRARGGCSAAIGEVLYCSCRVFWYREIFFSNDNYVTMKWLNMLQYCQPSKVEHGPFGKELDIFFLK